MDAKHIFKCLARDGRGEFSFRASRNESLLQCTLCQRVFASASALRYHAVYKVWQKCRVLSCALCQRVFTCSSGMKYHEEKKVSRRVKEAPQCTRCDKIFARKAGLKYHIDNGVCSEN